MLVYQSKLLGKTRKEAPSDAVAPSHKLLTRAGYIDQLASGIFSLLPLGYLTANNIENIVRDEMLALGATEVLLPALQPATLWEESGRLYTIDPPLFRVTDRHEKELVLGSTHEEVITDLTRKNIESYKDLPLAVFQIQTKFRNEMRSTGGLLRVREFQMKDLYSFHRTQEDLQEYYERVRGAYLNIFERCDLSIRTVQADSGSIGGAISHEFSIEAKTGEDSVAICPKCDFATNTELVADKDNPCPHCSTTLQIKACIENGHIFQLGTTYSEKLGATFSDEVGLKKPIEMGCYGIGIGRLMAAIAETHFDDVGLRWPETVSPFAVHVVGLQSSVMDKARTVASNISEHTSVLFDDRDVSSGEKLTESDLIGISTRVVISEKTKDKIEVKKRTQKETKLMTVEDFIKTLS